MKWTVETLSEAVDDEIRALPKDLRAAFLRLSERIESVGLERIGEPHLKHLRGKLWEMRLNGRDGIGRAIYLTAAGRLLAFAKKTQKTPRSVLALAEQLAREIR
jgi:phage-related protein